MSAFPVKIGDYALNLVADPINSDGSVPKGRPNPTRINWSKENSIKTHEISWPKYKTSRTSKETLWNLDLEFVVLTISDCQEIAAIVDGVGPYKIETAFKSMYMYIKSFSASSEAGLDDYHQTCSMKLIEVND